MGIENLSHQDHYGDSFFQEPKGEYSAGAVADTYERPESAEPTQAELDVARRVEAGEITHEEATLELDMLANRANS